MLPVSNMHRVWDGPVNSHTLKHQTRLEEPSHQPHDVYLRHLLEPSPTLPHTAEYRPDQSSHLDANMSRRTSSITKLSDIDDYRSSLQSQIQRSQINTSTWLAGHSTLVSPLTESSGNHYMGWFNSYQGSEPIQYAPWDVSLDGRIQVATSIRDPRIHDLESIYAGPSSTPTESDYSGSSYSIASAASASSSFAPSPEDWHQFQLCRSDPTQDRDTNTTYKCDTADATNIYPRRPSCGWGEDDSCWPVYPVDNKPVPSSFTTSDHGAHLMQDIQTDDIASDNDNNNNNNAISTSHHPCGHFSRQYLWNSSSWNVGRQSAQCHGASRNKAGTTVIKRTPQQARDEAQDESEAPTLEQRVVSQRSKHSSPKRLEAYENSSTRLSQREVSASIHVPAEKNYLLVCWRRAGLTYKEIKIRGNFHEAESTLRGRYRALTKEKHQRLRAPIWERKDVELLRDIVNDFTEPPESSTKDRVPWKKVAELIIARGGTYLFGPGTCKKKWEELAMVEHDSVEADDSQVEE